MKARVFVSLKSTVLDPQGQAVRAALNGHGHPGIADVRQGKVFDITLADGSDKEPDKERVKREIEAIAAEVLANPVIEEYRVEIVD